MAAKNIFKPVIAFAIAGAITFSLFFLMQSLIAMGKDKADKVVTRQRFEFIRTKRQSDVQTKNRELPKKAALDKQPKAPTMKMSQSSSLDASNAVAVQAPIAPDVNRSVDLAGGPSLSGSQSDRGIIPLVRIQPMYPRAAAERRIEGWVLLEFSISITGAVKNPRVIEASPPGFFESAALQAIRKWKYKPMVKNNKPVETRGVQVKLIFELDKAGG